MERLCTSRRKIEVAFKKRLGRSINEEVLRVRLDRAKTLLAQTDMKVYEIARVSGFSGAKHLSECFRRQEGQSPSSFRDRTLCSAQHS